MKISEIGIAAHWWCSGRKNLKHVHSDTTMILRLLFKTLFSYAYLLRQVPAQWNNKKTYSGFTYGGKNSIVFDLDLSTSHYTALRALLALLGDMHNLLATLQKLSLQELERPIDRALNSVDQYRNARNFFTHIDERISGTNRDGFRKHGVSRSGMPCARTLVCLTKRAKKSL